MKRFSMLASILFFFFVPELQAQHEAKAKSEIEKSFGSKYKNFRFDTKLLRYEGLRSYTSYYYIGENSFPLNFKCNTGAKLQVFFAVDIWSNGDVKFSPISWGHYFTSIKDPDWAQLSNAISNAYKEGKFNLLEEFSSSRLNDIIEVLEVGVLKPTDKEWEQSVTAGTTAYGVGTLFHNFENAEVYSENHLHIPVYVKVKKIFGNLTMGTGYEIASFNFKRDDCTKPFYYVPTAKKQGSAPIEWKTIKIDEKQYKSDEIKEFRRNSIGRELAEKKAKEEWDQLPKVNVPKFNAPKEFVFFVRDLAFTASKDQLKSFVLNNMDKKYFFDNSQYLLTHTGQEFVDKIIESVFGNERNNFRTVYCTTLVEAVPDKNRYTFKSKNGLHTTTIEWTNDGGVWRLSQFSVNLPSADKFESVECPDALSLETIKNDEFGFTALMPKGSSTKDWDISTGDRKIMYSVTVNGAEYVLIAYNYKSVKGNLSAGQMKATAEQNRKSWMLNYATYNEELSTWTLNGIEGAEARFNAKPSGSNVAAKPTWYRSVMQGKVLYELVISGIDWSSANDEFMNGLVSTAKIEVAPEAKDVKYKKGDYVLVNTSGSIWDKGIIEDVEADGRCKVRLYEENKTGTVGAAKLKEDPNPNKKAAGGKLQNVKLK
ncbi:MAG: hypothetical protein ACK40M_00625 [Flavobacteriales bacterium]